MIEINKLVRSKRKTLALIVEADGTLTVRAPVRMKEADIRGFIEAKAGWIKQKQARVRDEAPAPHRYVDGERFWYLGEEIPQVQKGGTKTCPCFGRGVQAGVLRPAGSRIRFYSLVPATGSNCVDRAYFTLCA